ncbi:MAG: M16 family metallopeptidase, partial [Terriglobales bacterium]
ANTVITMVGDISEAQALAAVRGQFDGWTGGTKEEIKISGDVVIAHHGQRTIKTELPDKSNTDVYMGHPVDVSVRSPDYFAALLGNAALGYDSFACRLSPVRDKYGLTYGISSAMVGSVFPYAPWMVNFSVNPVNYNRTLSLVESIVADYRRTGMTPAELAKEKSHLEGAFFVSLRGPKQLASKLCELEIAGLGPQYLDQFGTNLRRVTLPQVNASIKRYFSLDDAVISASGTLHSQSAKAPAP